MIRVSPADEIPILHLCCFMSWNYLKSQSMVFSTKIRFFFFKLRVYSNWRILLTVCPKAVYHVHHFFFKKLVLIWYHLEESYVPFHSTKAESSHLLQRLEGEVTRAFAQGIPLRIRQSLESQAWISSFSKNCPFKHFFPWAPQNLNL